MYPPTIATFAAMSKHGQNPANVIAHRAWREAQAMILAAASGGPRTLALIGAAGTGKTWLLGRLVSDLRSRGRQVRLELRGDVSPQMPLGAVLLVDEASRLDQASLERIANQQRGLVILADVPAFASRLGALPRPPATITLPTIDPSEVPDFVAHWAATHDVSAAITDDAVTRLVAHSGGTPRLITQLARAALALAEATGHTEIVGRDIDEAAALKTGALDPTLRLQPAERNPPASRPAPEPAIVESPAPKPAPAPPRRPARLRWPTIAAIGAPVVVASVLVVWIDARRPAQTPAAPAPPTTQATSAIAADPSPDLSRDAEASAEASQPEPATTFTLATASAPALAAAAAPAPTLAPYVAPALSPLRSSPVLSPSSLSPPALSSSLPLPSAQPLVALVAAATRPEPNALPAPAPLPQQAEAPPLAAAETPSVTEPAHTPLATRPAPELTASLSPSLAPATALPTETSLPVEISLPVAPSPNPEPRPTQALAPAGAPGLVVLARPGDTLPTLYAQIYRGHRPPPYEAVLAANPRPLRPGAIVIFPPPPAGWTRPDAVTAGRDLP